MAWTAFIREEEGEKLAQKKKGGEKERTQWHTNLQLNQDWQLEPVL